MSRIKDAIDRDTNELIRCGIREHITHHHNFPVGEDQWGNIQTIGYGDLLRMILEELGLELVHDKGTPPSNRLVRTNEQETDN